MKVYLITNDSNTVIVMNKMKNMSEVDNKEKFLKFIHKKNTNKGKLGSIKLIGPVKSNNLYQWVVYYSEPLNKNFAKSNWSLCFNDESYNVYNGAIVLYTDNIDVSEYPVLFNLKDINDLNQLNNLKNIKDKTEKKEISKLSSNTKISNKTSGDENGMEKNNVEEDDDDDEEIISKIYENNESDNDETEIVDTIDKSNDMNKVKAVELKVDLENVIEDNKNVLIYEKYDYESPCIPIE